MAETLGTVASILQLLDTALKAFDHIQDFRHAPEEQQQLHSEMHDLRPLLDELRHRIDADPSRKTLQQMNNPLTTFKSTMEQFKKGLEPSDGRLSKVAKRLTWTMGNKSEAKEYLGKFEQFKSLLNSWLLLDISLTRFFVVTTHVLIHYQGYRPAGTQR
jgi:hypothetical protein